MPIKPFTYEIHPIQNSEGINIGYEAKLKGEFVFGTPEQEFLAAKKLVAELMRLSDTDVLVVNLKEFDGWQSVGVVAIIKPLIELNRRLLGQGRVPVAVVGDKTMDYYDAVSDKFKQENDTPVLPWFASRSEFLQKYGIE